LETPKVVLTHDELAVLRRLAEESGQTPGEVVRRLILREGLTTPGDSDLRAQPQSEAVRGG